MRLLSLGISSAWMTGLTLAAIAAIAPIAAVAGSGHFQCDLSARQWQACPQRASAARRATVHSLHEADGLTFAVQGPAGESRSMRWSTSWCGDLSQYPFLVLEYKTRWLQRMTSNQDALAAICATPKTTAIVCR
jgi:hypothetical protein